MTAFRHLIREYKDKEPIAECGSTIKEKDGVFLACKVTCPKCQKTAAFKKAAKHPFYGVPDKPKLEPWEENAFKAVKRKKKNE